MKILVTGAFGFLGSNLCKRLISVGHDVLPVDRDQYNVKNLTSICKPTQLLCQDFFDKDLMDRVISGEFQVICHFAHTAGEKYCQENPTDTLMNNVLKTTALLEAARDGKVSKFIYASSASIYGQNENMKSSEIDTLEHSGIPSMHKYFNENIIKKFVNNDNMNILSLRIFNIYGRIHKGIDVNSQYVNKGSLDRNKHIDMLYIDDFIDCIELMINNEIISGEYNIGSGTKIALEEVKNALEGYSFIEDRRDMDSLIFAYSNINKISNAIGWEPKITDHYSKLKELVEEINKIPDRKIITNSNIGQENSQNLSVTESNI